MRRKFEMDQAVLMAQCADWNAKYPVGTVVEFHPVIGAPAFRTRATRTAATVLSGHTVVVWLEGESGCVAVDACVPVKPQHAATPTPGQLDEAAGDMYAALKAYELLDEKHSNCEDCEGNGEPEACGECFPFADDARLKMRAAIAKAEGLEKDQRAATPVQHETHKTPIANILDASEALDGIPTSKPVTRLEDALKTAVAAAAAAEAFAASIGYTCRFSPTDIKAMGISVLIGSQQGGRYAA